VTEIARSLHISKQVVSVHLRDGGRDPAARDGQSRRAERDQFAALWNAAADLGAAATALGLTECQAVRKAVWLRATGLRLKYMPRRPGLPSRGRRRRRSPRGCWSCTTGA